MFHVSKCPHCQKTITNAIVENIDINGVGAMYKGVSYYCPRCHCVLSVAMDPISLNADIVSRLLKALGKG